MTHPLVSAEGLVKRFRTRGLFRPGAVQAVTDVSFAVGRGETLGLVGESGSGKSTIGRMLLGLTPPSAGTIRFDGVDLSTVRGRDLRRLRRRLQPIFQDPYSSLDPRRRIGAQLRDGMVIHNLPAKDDPARIGRLLETVGLPADAARRFPFQFSGGQRQRISIARALSTEPEFIVADEPVSALDVSIQAQIVQLLADLRTNLGLSLLFISHDLPVVRSLCDRVIVLYLGRVMEEGPAEALFRRPLHPYTRALLSATPSFDPAKRRNRIVLEGDPPSPARPPSGCVFRTRCPLAIPACAEAVPAFVEAGGGHRAACIRTDVTAG